MKVVVDLQVCIGSATCVDVAPEVFRTELSGELTIIDEHPPEGLRTKVERAVVRCPTQAISITEDDQGGTDAAAASTG